VGLWDDRGNYSAATNVSGGSGAGAILKGDIWTISAVGTLGGVAVSLGDTVRALSDAPVQVVGSWSIAEGNLGYTPYNSSNPAGLLLQIRDSNFYRTEWWNNRNFFCFHYR
jgi:hypothetical protein